MIWGWDCFGVVQSDEVQPLGRAAARYIIDKNRSDTWFLSLANDVKAEAKIYNKNRYYLWLLILCDDFA
jgi:hypothetical protein